MRYLIAACAIVFAVAATPAEVAPVVEVQGFYIDPGADATAEVVGRAVSDARSAGSLFYAVVLVDEPASGATTYADGVLDQLPRTEGTVLVVAPETVGWAANNDIWTTEQLNDALDASLDGRSSEDVVVIFVDALVNPSSGGSSGLWILLLIIALIGGAIAFFVWRSNKASKRRTADALVDVKEQVQERIAALANDILDDEDEIGSSGNTEASDHFDAAAKIYSQASDRLVAATNEREVLAVSIDVDTGIWHLDCAEAILDGNPPPPKPEPPKPPPPEPAAPQAPPSPSSSHSGTGGSSSLPQYHRRTTRRSSFGANDILTAILAGQAARSMTGNRSSRRSSSSKSSRSGSSSRSRSSGRSRGGGRRRG